MRAQARDEAVETASTSNTSADAPANASRVVSAKRRHRCHGDAASPDATHAGTVTHGFHAESVPFFGAAVWTGCWPLAARQQTYHPSQCRCAKEGRRGFCPLRLYASSWRIARIPRRTPEGVPDRSRGGDACPPSAALPLRNPVVDQRRSRNGCPFALASRRPTGVRGPRG